MAKQKPMPGDSSVVFELDGEDVKLVPTLDACLRISRMHGGATAVVDKIMAGDVDTMAEVLAAGLEHDRVTKPLMEQMYRSGIFDLRHHLIRFVSLVNNGGRLPGMDDDEEDDKKKEGKGSS